LREEEKRRLTFLPSSLVQPFAQLPSQSTRISIQLMSVRIPSEIRLSLSRSLLDRLRERQDRVRLPWSELVRVDILIRTSDEKKTKKKSARE